MNFIYLGQCTLLIYFLNNLWSYKKLPPALYCPFSLYPKDSHSHPVIIIHTAFFPFFMARSHFILFFYFFYIFNKNFASYQYSLPFCCLHVTLYCTLHFFHFTKGITVQVLCHLPTPSLQETCICDDDKVFCC